MGGMPTLFASIAFGGAAAYLSVIRMGGQSVAVKAGAGFGVFFLTHVFSQGFLATIFGSSESSESFTNEERESLRGTLSEENLRKLK